MGFEGVEIKKILLQEEVYLLEIKDIIKSTKITALDYFDK